MSNAKDLKHRLIEAAMNNVDLLSVLTKERAEWMDSDECHSTINHMVEKVFTQEDRIFLQTVADEDLGLLDKPLQLQKWRLPAPKPPFWQQSGNVRSLDKDIHLIVHLSRHHLKAAFDNLSGLLSSSRSFLISPAPIIVGATRKPKGALVEELILPDLEGNIRITLTVIPEAGGKARFEMQIRQQNPDKAVDRARIVLSSDQGEEITYSRAGNVSFVDIAIGKYLIEIKPTQGEMAEITWRFSISFEEKNA